MIQKGTPLKQTQAPTLTVDQSSVSSSPSPSTEYYRPMTRHHSLEKPLQLANTVIIHSEQCLGRRIASLPAETCIHDELHQRVYLVTHHHRHHRNLMTSCIYITLKTHTQQLIPSLSLPPTLFFFTILIKNNLSSIFILPFFFFLLS